MSSWNKVPNEILNIILLYLNVDESLVNKRSNLIQCSLTCRRWRNPAQAVLFSEVHLLTTRDLEKISPIVLNSDQLRRSVKNLHYTSDCEFNMTVLLAIDLLFPNLEKVDFLGNKLLYSTFSNIFTKNEKFKNLTILPNPKNGEEAELYLKCLDYLKDRITCIELFDDNSNRSLYQNVHKSLHNYPKLRKLIIHAPFNNVDFNFIVRYLKTTFDSNLKLLQHISIASTIDSTYFSLFTTERNALSTKTIQSIYIDMFSITCNIPSKEFMLMIMNNFPGLKTFKWLEKNSGRMCQYLVPSKSLSATLLNFLKYIMKIPNCITPNFMMAHNNTIKFVEDLYTDIQGSTLIPPLSRALRLVVHAFENYYDLGEICLMNKCSGFQEIYFQKTCGREPSDFDYERMEILKRIGRFFNKVTLKVTFNKKNLVAFLDSIGKYCPRLTQLGLFGSGRLYLEESLDFTITHPAKNCTVKSLTLETFFLSQEQLIYIMTQLPSLESLILKNCIMNPGEYFFSICLPMLSLTYLEICLDTNLSFLISSKKDIYIKLVTEADRELRYCFLSTVGKTIGYTTIDSPSESAFTASITNRESITYFIYCKTVKKFTIKYIAAETGFYKQIDLFSKE